MFKRLFCLSVGAVFLAAVPLTPLYAGEEGVMEEIVVTGSRIATANLITNSPVLQIDSEELLWQGTVRVEDMLRNVPQVFIDQNTGLSNGATGTATIALRNLDPVRTLVLINGRRMPAGSPIQGGIGADINQIPGALIDRVEILTGGASATYGSDAVAGVLNFLMLDDFQGVRFDAQLSRYSHDNDNNRIQNIVTSAGFPVASGNRSDGQMSDFSLIIGGNVDGGRGNITAYVTYRDIDPVTQAERDYSSCALGGDSTACVGSSTIPQGRITDFGGLFDFEVAGTDFTDRCAPTCTTFNFGPLNYYQRPDERWTFGTFAHYEISEYAEAYLELMFADDRSVTQIAPSGAFFITDTLQCGNPLLSAQQFTQLCGQFGLTAADAQTAFLGRRNIEGGNRRDDLRHTTFRMVAGLRGDINNAWSYDIYGTYAEVSMERTYLNDLSITKIKRALDAVVAPAASSFAGQTVCRSVVNGPNPLDPDTGATDPNCVPWDIFTTGAVTPAMTNYLVQPLFARGTTDQTVISGYIAGDLGEYDIKLPWAETGIQVVLGGEYREDNLDFDPDNGFRTGDGAGQGGATGPTSGGIDVKEFFFEASIPIVEDVQFAEEVTLDFGYRYSDYNTGETTDTYGIRGGWRPIGDIKVRASFQRAIRAANIQELFLPQGFNLFDMANDPCAGAITAGQTTEGRTLVECALSGVTAAQFGLIQNSPAEQYNFLQGGNPDLASEEADTYSFGVILTPRFVDGLTVSVDYYDIEIEKGISNLNPEFILNECLDGNASQCALVNRGVNGDLWIGSDVNVSGHIVALQDNLAIERVKGVDVVADYYQDMGDWGGLEFKNAMGFITTWDQQELKGAPTIDCKGKWHSTCGFPTPEFQNNLRITWITPWSVRTSMSWRHISEVDDLQSTDVDLQDVDYLDLAVMWDVTNIWDFDGHATVRAGITNVFDREPPIAGGGAGPANNGNGNIFPGMYDVLGRYWFIGLSAGI